MRALIKDDLVLAHRQRALTPDKPILRGTAQNPDVFFQARETVNPFYDKTPGIVQGVMDEFAKITDRKYHLFDYVGHPEADRVIVMMGSGAETAQETVNYLQDKGEKVGVVIVRLYRPFSAEHLLKAVPSTVKAISVLDRTKEPGALGEPLYQDVVTTYTEDMMRGKRSQAEMPRIIGGRYGLSSKEFTPAMVKSVFDELKKDQPKERFTVGINEDVTKSSLSYDANFSDRVSPSFW
jgi:pyruvate-ferredoxin/flavodoxin oxidoreductase